MQFKSFMEALKGNQHKIDKNKNGKIDAHDFKLLQKEESEQLEEGLDPSEVASNPKMYDAATVKKAYYHKSTSSADKEYLAKHLDRHHGNKEWRKPVKEEMKEEMTDAQMKKREEIVKSMKKDTSGFKDRYGDRAKEVMYATATKMAMKEEVEHVDYILEYESDLAKMKKSDSYKVGDKVWTKVGGQWHRGNITTPLNKAGNHGVKFHHKGMTHSTVSNPHSELRLNVEELDEKSDQAKRNKTMKNMMDASRGARFKLNNPVPDAEPEHKTARAHNVAIGRALRNEEEEVDQVDESKGLSPSLRHGNKLQNDPGLRMGDRLSYRDKPNTSTSNPAAPHGKNLLKSRIKSAIGKHPKPNLPEEANKENPPFDGPYTKTPGTTKDKSGAVHTPMSKVRHLARMAMKKQMKEQFELEITDEQADTILDAINEQAPVAPVPGMKFKNHAVMVHPETKSRVVINRKNVDNYTSDGYKEVRPGQKLKEDDDVKFSYTELMMINEIKLADLPVRRVKGHSYGADYSDPEGADDYDDKKPMKPAAEKRGRGRPAGAQSGARKNFGSSKLHTK